jgi:hypothetical protein
LLKRSKDARALAIEFGETVLEIRDLLIRGIVHRYALSRLHNKTEHHSWESKSDLSAHALHDPLQRIAGILMLVAVDDERFSIALSTSLDCQRDDSSFASAVRMSKQG